MIGPNENSRNVGSLDKNYENVETSSIGAPAYGDVMQLQIKSMKMKNSEHSVVVL